MAAEGVSKGVSMKKNIKNVLRRRFFRYVRGLKRIVNEYEKYVTKHSTKLPYGIPEKKLPYPKKVIQRTLERLYTLYTVSARRHKTERAKKRLEELETFYAALGSFMPESRIEYKTPLINPSYEELESFLLHIQKVSDYQTSYAQKLKEKPHIPKTT